MSISNLSQAQIDGYKNTVINILSKQISILKSLENELKRDDALNTEKKDVILTYQKSLDYQDILQGEINKLQNFDVVLAVVGTMKAGKSTTINAIVGREILPNRNRPMTALPTLICHNPSESNPKLTIKVEVLNEFLTKIKEKVDGLNLSEGDESIHKDMLELIEFIKSGNKFQNSYEGEENIFTFLRQLNDLVRLAKDMEKVDSSIKFPFEAYKNFENLPKIDVAFNLNGDFKTNGRFMLLDTAGPNEAGQEELITSLEEQLERSSAVMVVLDYTQLNSQAEADVKEQLDKIPTIQKQRLFALVNKFDQKNSNADEADATRKHIFHNLLKDKIELENIFAVSAQDSYLANRMASHIETYNNSPEFKENTWVEDFSKKMFGEMASMMYPTVNIDMLKTGINAIIIKSRMQEPLENVIVNMQRNAPFIAIQSALAGASDIFNNLHNKLDISSMFADKDKLTQNEINELSHLIQALEQQINSMIDEKQKIINQIEDVKKNIDEKISLEAKIAHINDRVKYEVENLFIKERDEAKNEISSIDTGNYYSTLKTVKKMNKEKEDLDKLREKANSDGKTLVFSSGNDLDRFEDELRKRVYKTIDELVIKAFEKILLDSKQEVENVTEDIKNQCMVLLNKVKEDFGHQGVDLKINFNPVGELSKDNGFIKFRIEFVNQSVNKTYNQSGPWGAFKRGLGNLLHKDWGTYTVNYETYTINIQKTIEQIRDSIRKEFVEPLRDQLKDKTSLLLEQSMDNIDNFENTINEIINEVKLGIEREKSDVELSVQEKQAYKQQIIQNKKEHDELEKDWEKIASLFEVDRVASPTA